MRKQWKYLCLIMVVAGLFLINIASVSHAETFVSGNILEDTTWTLDGSPYIVTGDVTVRYSSYNSETATLTIEPGVEVRFEEGTGLFIGYSSTYYGALSAQGTASDPIVFTSNAATPAPGDWKGIYFRKDTNNNTTILDHCLVEYGGNGNNTNIYCNSASPTIKSCTIQYSSANGIYLTGNSSPMIGGISKGNTISHNGTYGIYSGGTSPLPNITFNTLSFNGSYAMRVRPRMGDVSDNTGTGNGNNNIEIIGETVLEDTTWQLNDLPYVVSGDVTVRYSNYNSATATLTIDPGVEVRFEEGTGFFIGYGSAYYGALSARGTASDPVVFTSNASTPAPGDWKGIYFRKDTDDAATTLEHCLVEYGGNTYNTNIYCFDAAPTIKSCTVQHSSARGIYMTGNSNPVIGGENAGNTISNNATYGIYSGGSSPLPSITFNTLSSNGSYAMRLRPRMADVSDNTGTGNGKNGIEVIGETVLQNTTWQVNDLPYMVSGDIRVRYSSSNNATAMLTIDPGVEVRFEEGTGLLIGYGATYYGALSARGTASDPIVFTSNATPPAPGDWKGIYFQQDTDDAVTILEHCMVEYGGNTYSANIYCNSASPAIKSCALQHSSASGIHLTGNSNPAIGGENAGNTISNNSTYGIYSGATNPFPSITFNTLSSNGSYAMRLRPQMGDVSDNTGTDNGKNGIEVIGETVLQDATWQVNDLPYMITGDVTIRYSSSNSATATLTIDPGVEVRFETGTGMFVGLGTSYHGALSARGTAANPIVFTSNAATPAPGDWKGIYFRKDTNDTTAILEHCIVEYGGNAYSANIYCNSASPTIKSSTIQHSSASGIHLYENSNPVIGGVNSGNNISSNGTYGIYSGATNPFPNITFNTLSSNGSYAMRLRPQMGDVSDNTGTNNGKNGIEVIGVTVLQDTTWQDNDLPYMITGDVTVRYSSSNSATATLTINPGVEVRFETGTGLFVGYGTSYYGALSAQGTASDPIVFTSNATMPNPGDWKGLFFKKDTNDAATHLEHCIIEYGGYANNADIYLKNASPTLQYNTIRNSSHSGIYAYGDGSDNAILRCNNIKDNVYGIYTASSAQPGIEQNNFLGSRSYGVYNAHTQEVIANNNWWGDPGGPNLNGDAIYGSVTAETWLTTQSDCINAPPTNSPPFAPKLPVPADNAVRIPVLEEGQPADVALGWTGGDPNPWDTVVYDVYLGTASDALSMIAENLADPSYSASGLGEGVIYYWKVVARDDTGAETSGPVWKFTTLGAPPDLVVSAITWEPLVDLESGQTITFTATIENTGTGPVVDAFTAAFAIDGATIGTQTVEPVIPAGGTIQVSLEWTAATGLHTIEVVADSANTVVESFEENNTAAQSLPMIVDTTPPELVSIAPADGSMLQAAETIVLRLSDPYGEMDDASVISSFSVMLNAATPIAGTITENNDTYTFTPDVSPFADGIYQVAFTAADNAGNTANFQFSFTIDGAPPTAPTLTGGSVLSGILQVRPAANQSNTASVTLTGTREDNTSVWVNNVLKAASGTGDWSFALNLSQGENALEIWVQDTAGNKSDAIWVDISVDSIAPSVTAITPAGNTFLNVPPATLVATYVETGSSLKWQDCVFTVTGNVQGSIAGNWDTSTPGSLVFTPASAFIDDIYTISLTLKDTFENAAAPVQSVFTIDTQAPTAPVVNPVTTPTHNPVQVISGTKQAYASVLLDGQQIISNTADTAWQHSVSLESGTNTFTFASVDRAGNQSADTVVEIVFDDIAPDRVTTLVVNGNGDGKTAVLNWTGYDESAHGDIAEYEVYYQAVNTFTDVSAMTAAATVSAGTFTRTVEPLTLGQIYWFAVVAKDNMGNTDPVVSPISAVIADVMPPENVTDLVVETCYDNQLDIRWTHSENSDADLAGYKVYIQGQAEPVTLPSTQNTYTVGSLLPAASYTIRVTAYDASASANESTGTQITGYTLLENPSGLAAQPFSGYVELSWSPSTPSENVKHYAIYMLENTDFTSVETLTPVLATAATTAKVAGLVNNTPYYFAVTAINLSNGEKKSVATIAATPLPDSQGPELSNLKAGSADLVDNLLMGASATLSLDAQDPSGVSRVEFYLDGNLVRTDYSAPYTFYLDMVLLEDGNHTLAIHAFDTLSNETIAQFNLILALEAPAAPVISSPSNGKLTNVILMPVTGMAEKNSDVLLYNNDALTGDTAVADAGGSFALSMNLVEGENRIQAAAKNRAGTSALSATVVVTLDTSLPHSPVSVSATPGAGGIVNLSWNPPSETVVSGYNIFRAENDFSDPAQAQKINTSPVTATTYIDTPPQDGTWYYGLTTIDPASNESDLSDVISATADSIAPRAASITYAPHGNVDPASGTMAPGTVDVVLTVTEPLQAMPFFSITPEGGTPASVSLIKENDLTYTGFFVIAETMPTGTAYAIFSARDQVGNRGTEIDVGASIKIDTNGPSVSRLVIQPAAPVKNDENNPVTLMVTIGLDEPAKTGTSPVLEYTLSATSVDPSPVNSLVEITPQGTDVQTWQGTIDLSSQAGLAEAETLGFLFEALDELDNMGTGVPANSAFQIYQGDLPPLEAPSGLSGKALPQGKIQLTWYEVPDATAYQLYRQAPTESELTPFVRLEGDLEYLDETVLDGAYVYAVSSIRTENQQEAVSGMSASVTVDADSVSPGAPVNFALELVANGIKATWDAPAWTEPVTYSLYRASGSQITSVDGLSPLATGIDQTLVVDPTPSKDFHCYTVTAVDATGNESLPSDSFYLNFELLPVASLDIVQTDGGVPQLSWTHTSNTIAGYEVYLGSQESGIKLNTDLLTAQAYDDTGYTGDERTYTVVAVDTDDGESLGRSITLPIMTAALSEDAAVKRGIMNHLSYGVENHSDKAVTHIKIKADVGGIVHTSDSFDLDAGQSAAIPVVVGGYADLEDLEPLTTTIEITPDANEKVEIISNSTLQVGDGMMGLSILNEEFTRGGTGQITFTLTNTGEEEIEIVTAKNSGNAASDDIVCFLLDEDDNIITAVNMKQATGAGVVTIADKTSVARIPAGKTFTSGPLSLQIPENAPDNVMVNLSIANIYYHKTQDTQVKMEGLSTTHEITLVDTSYYGEVIQITPESSVGDQDIVITGRAVERATSSPLANAALNLVITLDGFERSYEVITKEDGSFSYAFTPLSGEAGVYTVRAVHPDLTDRPVHGTFTINRVTISPSSINLSIPQNYEQTIKIKVNTGDGTQVNNVRLVYEALDQPYGEFAQGVHVDLGSPIETIGSDSQATLSFVIWADNTADATGSLVLKVKSDETDPDAWGTLVVNAHFSVAKPALFFTPDHLETGVAIDNVATETIVLENKGLSELSDVQIALVDTSGGPVPSWVLLNSSADQGNMGVGDTRDIGMSFSPTAGVSEGMYEFYLRITSANYPTTDINLYVSVTQSGIGSVLFKVSDIYTGTLDENSQIIQGLSGAKIKVQNEKVLTEEHELTTDSFGEALFSDLPSGTYKCRITADNHQEYIGRFWIKPGITVNEVVFLDYNLVTVEWEVNEITIEDRYEIVLTAVYETDVPAPVLVLEPTSLTLPPMKAGDVLNGEFTLTNYGLIRADAMKFALPADDANFTYELLGGLPESLDAKERITIPYRVTCLNALEPEDGDDTGGGCHSYLKCMTIDYGWYCINGVWGSSAVRHCWSYTYGECSGVGYVGGGSWSSYYSGGSGGSSGSYKPETIKGVICFPDPERTEGCFDKCARKPNEKDSDTTTRSSVNTVMREYNRDHVDLSVKVPGGVIEAKRWYFDNQWQFEHLRHNLKFNMDALGIGIESIDKSGIIYEVSSIDPDMFKNDTYRIEKTQTGFRWEDKRGTWKLFDTDGRMTSYGTRDKTLANLIYEEGEDGKLTGIADRNNTQVIWFEYTGDLISAVSDTANRRVQYSYTGQRISTVTDALGKDTSYSYDGKGRLVKTVDATGHESNVTYDGYGNVSSVLDNNQNGHFFEFGYDEGTKETSVRITTSLGMVKDVWYDRWGKTKRVDINGRTIKTLARDGRDLIITDEKGAVTRNEYDEWDNLTKVIHADGSEAAFEYEHSFNRKIKETNENGIITAYSYDADGNLTKKIEASGSAEERLTQYSYDDDGNLLTITRPGDAATPEAVTVMAYDADGNLASVTDPEGGVTQFTAYDIMGNVLTKIDARGKQWTYAYDGLGQLTLMTDPLGNETRFEYDARGNKTKEVDAIGREKTYEYDFHDNLIQSTDASGGITWFAYNTDNKLIQQTDPEGKNIHYQYDNEGRLIKTTDGSGNDISMEYEDALGTGCSSCSGGSGAKPYRITYPTFEKEFIYDRRGRKTHEKEVLTGDSLEYMTYFSYDDTGNLIAKTDKNDKTTSYAYDALNRLETVTDPLNQDTAYLYDGRDNLIKLTDANGSTTWFAYDKNNRLLTETRPMGEETAYQYDPAGNLVEKVDAKGQKAQYTYDDAGRLTEIQYFNPTDPVNPVKTVAFTYDAAGNLLTYDDGVTSAEYAYDAVNRKIEEVVNYGGFLATNAYGYYKNGLKKTFTGTDGIAYAYTYDDANRLASVDIPGNGRITINSYKWNRPETVTLPGGATRSYVYDPLMRAKTITSTDPAANPVMAYEYAYDPMDNITEKNTEHGDYDYAYDGLYRLKTVDNPELSDENYTYDGVGNRTTSADTTSDWTYSENNELGGYDDVSYQYDANGNMIEKTAAGVTTLFFYNIEDRLVRVEDGDGNGIAAYTYDPFGRRLWKEAGGVKTCFIYADEGLVGETDATGTVSKTYGYKPGATWTTDPLFMKQGTEYYFYHNDHLGTPQKITAINGAVVWSAMYTAFGEAQVIPASSVENCLRFAGQYYDSETGLHYNYHRYYDPMLGIYLRADPIGLEGGLNLYAYVLNDPINSIDPLGFRTIRPPRSTPEWWRRPNPYNLPWDQPPGRRAPGGSSSGCKNVLMEFCDEWCCDFDYCTGKCKTKCPMISTPEGAKKAKRKCTKKHWEWVTICNGKVRRYR